MHTRISTIARTFALGLAALVLATSALAGAREDRALAREGVVCQAQSGTTDNGETHWCLFSPERHGRHDFSRHNSRAGYVVSALGPDCDMIEILADEEYTREGDAAPRYRRVSVACSD